MSAQCHFEFDRGNPIYFCGETVQAKITLIITSEITCREVYVEFKGEAKVKWSERRNNKSRTFRAQETYITKVMSVHGGGKLEPGVYTYDFSCAIIETAPASCAAKYGQIVYEISLVIDRPLRFDNVFRRPLTVLKNFDLNSNPELLIPLQAEDTKFLCFWHCKSGPVISTFSIPYGGYVPGQVINYTLQIDNESNGYDVFGARLQLVQTYTFTASTPVSKDRTITTKIAELDHSETILRLSKRILQGALNVPAAPPSTPDRCIIRVTYNLEMTIKTGRCHKNSTIVIPITLGTVPLYQALENFTQTPNAVVPSAPPN